MSMNHESTVNHWPPIINNRSTPCYLTPVYSDVLLGSFSGVIFFATLLSAVWLHHQYILHHNINLLIIHFHSTNRNILRVHCVFRWNFTDLSSLIGLEQQNNTSSSQITWRHSLTYMITSTAFRYQTWSTRKMAFRQPHDHGEVSDPFPPGELSTACPPVSAAQPG